MGGGFSIEAHFASRPVRKVNMNSGYAAAHIVAVDNVVVYQGKSMIEFNGGGRRQGALLIAADRAPSSTDHPVHGIHVDGRV